MTHALGRFCYADEIVHAIGRHKIIVEPGSGSSEKIQLLLNSLQPYCYVPIEISSEYMLGIAAQIRTNFPTLDLLCVKADYTYQLPKTQQLPLGDKVAFFPGSTIGNFSPQQAVAFLQSVKQMVNRSGGLLIGVDLKKPVNIVERAYNDEQGITAAFNKNMLNHVNRLTGSNFDLKAWDHSAKYDDTQGCVHMHLKNLQTQQIAVGGHTFEFDKGDAIHTENWYKYSIEDCEKLFAMSGFEMQYYWTDINALFAVIYCEAT